MTRDNNKKTHYVVLGGKGGGQAESVEWSDIQNKPAMATETLTFTLQGGTTQTIVVYTQPTV